MALLNNELEHLLNFVGYGRLDAPVWFLGMEEAGGGEDNLRARLKFRAVEDCAEAHRILGITKHHWERRVIQRTWRGMCYIMLKLDNKVNDAESIRNYQAELLGRFGGQTLLVELMPIPKPSIGTWSYEELIPQYASREDYYLKVKPRRLSYLQGLIRENKPQIVVGYGKSYWPEYQALFGGMDFSSRGQFMVGKTAGLTVVLTDHFTAQSMNGKLDEVVSILKG
ncbi:MAG: hypothetical protein NTW32_02535 [Chloroflexi bacterium]|nr:hypothetical protein [Chloroflexota bacterium]